jgi:hypothetical protein
MLLKIAEHRDAIDPTTLVQNVQWVPQGQRTTART